MAFYEPQGWQAPARQPSWEQPPPPSRSGASSSSQREDGNAFATQFEGKNRPQVDRAVDNLIKSGKYYLSGPRMPPAVSPGRPFNDYGPRMHGPRHSVSDFDPSRSHSSSNLQNFYASQRFQGRHGEPDQMMQAKRRMAAQRERELRNYHQEQQYNRSLLAEMASNKSDRSMSPSTLSEEGRRDLIARQHRALYGADNPSFLPPAGFGDEAAGREQAGGNKGPMAGAPRGPSPRAGDPFGMPSQMTSSGEMPGPAGKQDSMRADKVTSPTGQAGPAFAGFESSSQQVGKAPTPPAGDDGSHSRQLSKSTTAPLSGGMAPIGSRPNTQQVSGQPLNKRTTSPLPSSLPYSFGATEQNNERSTSSNSNANAQKESSSNPPSLGTWGTGGGVWGSNKIGATSVWG